LALADEAIELFADRARRVVMQSCVLGFRGDITAARAMADAAYASCDELVEEYEAVCHSTAAAAHLAAGDATAARHAYEKARQFPGPPVMVGTFALSPLAPLACGDLTAASRWADEVVSGTTGCNLSASLATRARVETVSLVAGSQPKDMIAAVAGWRSRSRRPW
jgi:uncharacterized membrane-anchored protein